MCVVTQEVFWEKVRKMWLELFLSQYGGIFMTHDVKCNLTIYKMGGVMYV